MTKRIKQSFIIQTHGHCGITIEHDTQRVDNVDVYFISGNQCREEVIDNDDLSNFGDNLRKAILQELTSDHSTVYSHFNYSPCQKTNWLTLNQYYTNRLSSQYHLCIILELLIAKFLTGNAAFPVPVYLSKENENPGEAKIKESYSVKC
ncbi:hypothetical protein PV327_001974 [Microctonus hyperodae]|uniref:Uncharacterized protein n=1 Tax=Microctonus hyperodae TaxID=165561 RepID=A0AA39KNU6_MICHY|nr:hypothetical protein PV327_001974 [Microctonus hyperodae]